MIQFTKNPIVEAIHAAQCTTVGQVVTDAPVAEFLWDFIEKLSLGPFSPTDHRASGATGPDNEGMIKEVGDNVPVFPGARVVQNVVARLPDGVVNFNPIGTFAYTTIPGAGPQGQLVHQMVFDVGSFNYEGLSNTASYGNEVFDLFQGCQVREVSGVEDTGIHFYSLSQKSPFLPISSEWRTVAWNYGGEQTSPWRIAPEGGKAVVIQFCDVMAEINVSAPSSHIEDTQWYDTTNGNTVAPGTGIVTENPGVPIDGIRGVQLEGERTNELPSTDMTDAGWWARVGTFDIDEYSAVIASPSGAMDALHVRSADLSGNIFRTGTSDDTHKAIWARSVSGAGAIHLMTHNSAVDGLVSVTEEWRRFDLQNPNPGTGSANFYAIDFRDVSATLNEVLLWLPQSEAGATFSSSDIPTDGSAVTRAATKAIAPFTSIPELPDELVNDFCGQVTFLLGRDLDAPSEYPVFFEVNSGTLSSNRVNISQPPRSGEITLSVTKSGVNAASAATGLTAGYGDLVDIRFRVSSETGSDWWVNGEKKGNIPSTADFPEAMQFVAVNSRTLGTLQNFGNYQLVRIVPEALSDAEIEAWDPPPPATPEFLWDFREELTLGPFSPTDHRGSGATGPDHEGIIRDVGDNVPVFPGARSVVNIASDIAPVPWAPATLTDNLDGTYTAGGIVDKNSFIRVRLPDLTVPIYNRSFAWAAEVRGAGTDIGKNVRMYQRRYSGGTFLDVYNEVVLTDDWQRVAAPTLTGLVDNMGLECRITGSTTNSAAGFDFRMYQIDEATGQPNMAPSTYVEQAGWFNTTNANTVDPTTGIVTENPGAPIPNIKGLQLEGVRTNSMPVSDASGWGTASATATTHPTIPAPDGSMNAVHCVNTGSGYVFKPIVGSTTTLQAIWARTISGTGTASLLNHNSTGELSDLTEAWERFPLQNNAGGTGDVNFYAVDFRGAGTLSELLVYFQQAEDGADFASSDIPATDSAETRAPTKAIAPFTSITELPPEGLPNNFSWQAVLELRRPLDVSGGAQVLFELYGSASYYIVVETSSAVPGRITLTMNKGGTTATINFDGVTAGTGDTVDLRGRASFTDGVDCWLDNVKGATIANTNDFLSPIDTIAINGHTVGGDECFTVGQIVRIVPEALSDAEIEAWDPVPLNRLLVGDLTVGEDPSGTTLKYGYVEGEFGAFTGADTFSTVAVAEDISYNPNVVLVTKHGTGYGQLMAQLPDFDLTITMEWVPLNNRYEVKHNQFRNRIEAANGTTLPINLYLPELPDPVTTTWTPEINGNLVGYDVDAYGAIGRPDLATRFTTNRNSPGMTVLRPADGAWYGGYVEVYVAETDTTLGMLWDTNANWWWCDALAFGNDIYDNYAGQELTITVTAVESVQEGEQ